MKIISWNIHQLDEPWRCLLDMGADIALLQEAGPPPPDVAGRLIKIDPADWATAGPEPRRKWRTAIVQLSDCVAVEWIEGKPVMEAGYGEFPVSVPGTLTAARVTPHGGKE